MPCNTAWRFPMDLFFDRKQILIGAVLLGLFEFGVVLVRAFAR